MESLLLDGNTALADIDLDAGGLLPCLVELIAQDGGGDGEYADDEVENVAIHGHVISLQLLAAQFKSMMDTADHIDPNQLCPTPDIDVAVSVFLVCRELFLAGTFARHSIYDRSMEQDCKS